MIQLDEIKTITLKPNQVLLIQTKEPIRPTTATAVTEMIKKTFPNNNIIFASTDDKFTVIDENKPNDKELTMKATMKHTLGPWEHKQVPYNSIETATGISIMGDEQFYPWCPENIADWKLIAAAPDLLEALELIASTDPVDAALDPQRAMRVAKAAIAKALGK